MKMRSRIRSARVERGSQLLELAMVLPMLLVLTAGVVDMSQAWNARQILANASREGTRLAVGQVTSDLDNDNPPDIQLICQTVADYLSNENMNVQFMNNVANSGSSSATISGICSKPGFINSSTCTGSTSCEPEAWTYCSTGCPTQQPTDAWMYGSSGSDVGYGLQIERSVGIPPSGFTSCGVGTSVACIESTRVILRYQYNWSFGFNHIINLFGSGQYVSTIPLEVYSTMANLAG
jgi:TadE-like protein